MQNTQPDNETQPQHVSDAADTSSTTTGASSQPPEQVIESAEHAPGDAAAASAPALDEVLEASLESFPASDPPSWTCGNA